MRNDDGAAFEEGLIGLLVNWVIGIYVLLSKKVNWLIGIYVLLLRKLIGFPIAIGMVIGLLVFMFCYQDRLIGLLWLICLLVNWVICIYVLLSRQVNWVIGIYVLLLSNFFKKIYKWNTP